MELRERMPVRQKTKTRAIVRTRTRLRIRWSILGILMTISVLLGLFAGSINRYTEIALLGRSLSNLETRHAELTAERDHLKLVLMTYVKQSRIEEVAKSALGMEYKEQASAEPTPPVSEIKPVQEEAVVPDRTPTILGKLSAIVFNLLQ